MSVSVTASIVTFNSSDEISNVLDSLLACKIDDLKIIVVDNASQDNTCEIVEKEYSGKVSLIKSLKNIGFGAGHNLAIKNINSDYHIFVNPDITVYSDELIKMLDFMKKNSDVAVLTPKVLNPDGSEQFLPKRYPKLKYILSGKFENKSKYFYKLRSEYTMRDINVLEPIEVDFCTGCFMLCRTSALKKVGGFDERYFLHFEDADLTREMKQFGKTMYVPSVFVIHKWHRDNIKNKKIQKIAIESMFKYLKKWRHKNEKHQKQL